MAFTYNPLWKLLIDKNISREELRSALGFSFSTMTKMTKGQFVSLEVLHRMCVYLNCQPGDLLQYIPDND
ncbi:MAG: XRE family transcriptional regulator [Desulfosporosinus sp. BRH_c37]|nr:MAG: XRE family transcriptional regulator [Desulfosporosinus sp. BRH_c37]